jgi:hypothetical protein
MPELRTIEGRERLRAPVAIVYDPDTRAKSAAQRRRRRGASGPVPVEVRNGLPFKPYVYRGVGYDIYTGDDDA